MPVKHLYSFFKALFTAERKMPENRFLMKIVALNTRHVYGPRHIDCKRDEVIVVCPVKDGEECIEAFIDHHFRLGVKHIVFLDNGSTDSTLKTARSHENITVLVTKLPFRKYAKNFRAYLKERFSRNCWCLCVDVDELFDYPYSDRIGLREMLSYLNDRSHNAVLANMLEVFSDKPLSALQDQRCGDIRKEYRFYDFSGFEKRPITERYRSSSISDRNMCEYKTGGIRKTVFGWTKGHLCKYPLVFLGTGLRAEKAGNHRVFDGARIADFSTVLLHYQFTGSLHKRCVRIIKERNYHRHSRKYRKYFETLRSHPDINLKQEARAPREFRDTNELIENGFMHVSDAFREYVHKCESDNKSILK